MSHRLGFLCEGNECFSADGGGVRLGNNFSLFPVLSKITVM